MSRTPTQHSRSKKSAEHEPPHTPPTVVSRSKHAWGRRGGRGGERRWEEPMLEIGEERREHNRTGKKRI